MKILVYYYSDENIDQSGDIKYLFYKKKKFVC